MGEWKTETLGVLGSTYTGLSGKSAADFGQGSPYITYLNVFNNAMVDTDQLECVDIKPNERQNAVKKGDVLFTTSSETPEEVGMSSVLTEDIGKVYLNSFCFGWRLKNPEAFHREFLAYALRSRQIRHQMLIAAQGSTRHNLSKKNFNRIHFKYPVLTTEQSKIAEVLSAADDAINKARALLEKYRNIKTGLMQDLLWKGEEVQLNACLRVCHGKSQKSVEDINGKYPILGSGGLMGYANSFLWDKPSVLVGRKGTIDQPRYMENPFWTIDTMYYTDIYSENCAKYFYYLFQTIPWKNFNEATGVPSLSSTTIGKIRVRIIRDRTKQIEIAEKLTAADKKMESEQSYLTKLLNIKNGLMQDLLTNTVSVDILC